MPYAGTKGMYIHDNYLTKNRKANYTQKSIGPKA